VNAWLWRADADNCKNGFPVWTGGVNDLIAIDFEGTSQLGTKSDWAYQQYSLPALNWVNGDWQDRLNGIPLGGWYVPALTSGCMLDLLPRNADLTNVYAPATQSNSSRLLWTGEDIGADEFVVRHRNADEIGNALLAAGAFMAGLSIGFIPFAYDAEQKRRQARNRRHARQGTHPA